MDTRQHGARRQRTDDGANVSAPTARAALAPIFLLQLPLAKCACPQSPKFLPVSSFKTLGHGKGSDQHVETLARHPESERFKVEVEDNWHAE